MKRKLLGLLCGLFLCLALASTAFAEDTNTVTVTVYELEPGYYMGAVWDGDTLLTLFDADVGNDGVLKKTVEIGDAASSDTVQIAISPNTDSGNSKPIIIKDAPVNGSVTSGNPPDTSNKPSTPSTPNTPGTSDSPNTPSKPDDSTASTYLVSVYAAPVEGGVVTGNGIYSKGQAVTVRAYPASGYRFVYWIEYGVVVSYNAAYLSPVTGDRTLIAVFEQISIDSSFSAENLYRINTPAPSNGTLTVRPSVAKYGDRVTITATPYSGYTIDNISVMDRNGRSISVRDNGNSYTFTMPASWVTVNAVFAAIRTQTPSTTSPAATNTTPTVSTTASSGTLWVSPFIDVLGVHSYYADVGYVVQNGLMNGVDNRHFDPSGYLTRGMVMTILARMKGIDTSGSIPWFQAGMTWAKQAGISDGSNPEAAITREELITMLWRYAGQPAPVSSVLIDYSTVVGDLSAYNDVGDISAWAYNAMKWAVQRGILDGADGKLHPQDKALRADTATVLARFLKKY